jgi:hypothetical protein
MCGHAGIWSRVGCIKKYSASAKHAPAAQQTYRCMTSAPATPSESCLEDRRMHGQPHRCAFGFRAAAIISIFAGLHFGGLDHQRHDVRR